MFDWCETYPRNIPPKSHEIYPKHPRNIALKHTSQTNTQTRVDHFEKLPLALLVICHRRDDMVILGGVAWAAGFVPGGTFLGSTIERCGEQNRRVSPTRGLP